MRLNETERAAIIHNARKHFGADASVRLFGSRVDQSKKGGDIDLLIHADHDRMNLKKKIAVSCRSEKRNWPTQN